MTGSVEIESRANSEFHDEYSHVNIICNHPKEGMEIYACLEARVNCHCFETSTTIVIWVTCGVIFCELLAMICELHMMGLTYQSPYCT